MGGEGGGGGGNTENFNRISKNTQWADQYIIVCASTGSGSNSQNM